MNSTFWGQPVEMWVGLCLAVAAFYTILWPRPMPGEQRSPWTGFLLRWGHALVWALLAAALLAYRYIGLLPAQVLGLAGLILYVLFMATLLRRRPKPRT
jgi:drug/metabolite transporter (DMT)-like permease